MKCKFCGCTDERACVIGYVYGPLPDDANLLALMQTTDYPYLARPDEIAEVHDPCHWIAPNICSAPPCVEKAYAEACALMDQVLSLEAV